MAVRRAASPKRARSQLRPQHRASEQTMREMPLADVIATSLEEDIVLGRRHPRERLIEQDLCDRFHTHRGDVRLALFELEKKASFSAFPIAAQSCAISRPRK